MKKDSIYDKAKPMSFDPSKILLAMLLTTDSMVQWYCCHGDEPVMHKVVTGLKVQINLPYKRA